MTTALAFLLVLFALNAPDQVGHLTPWAFARVPLEGLLGVALVLVLPPKPRRVAAALAGVALALVTIVKFADLGFYATLQRPFDLLLDWAFLGNAVDFLTASFGGAGAVAAVVAVAVLIAGVLVLVTLSVMRLARVVARHRTPATGAAGTLGAAWLVCALFGVQITPEAPAAALVHDHVQQIGAGLRDQRVFAAQAAVDAFRDTPGKDLLTALRGKDVVFSFIESYGRDAVEDPEFAPQVDAVLDAGSRRLRADGFASRSAFLTSPTYGGGSWLAHATLLSGLWVNNQQRHGDLVAGDRLTMPSLFRRAGWRTVAVMPGNTKAWPEGAFYGYDRVYDSHNLGYRGPGFNWGTMPDQYTLSAFQRLERAKPGHAPMMVEMPLVSSHAPWAPIPSLTDWNAVGDGSVFGPMAAAGESPDAVWRDATRVRTEYRRSIEYTLSALISYVETYGDDDLVLVFLGDHQPAPIVTGENASRDVPITIVARDRAVLDRVSGWGWQDGLRPGPTAPVWRMDAFRDRFLTAFGPHPQPTRSSAPAPR
ncbi:sulfatase-like hydrolase/transferase [Sphaerisporangium rhizosphaerae]|uniref:Sulfatase-like hydrolase/transferase n=1 Tax=Sphaerisporangium rhizosphaerae TaxID=2269375 RepID=A0ABW2NYN4_9ACTN